MTQVVILAAGKGRRMGGDIPKVLTKVNGKSLIGYLFDSVIKSGVCVKPLVVVGYKADMVKDYLGDKAFYVHQDKNLGTGNAVACTRGYIPQQADSVLVLYGDMPFLKPETIKEIVETYNENKPDITLMTIKLKDFGDWRSIFSSFGRVVRNENNEIIRIREVKDATEEEKEITEVNPSYFCFDKKWLFENIGKLKNNNKLGEYYLTDLVELGIQQGDDGCSLVVDDPTEGIGVNTPEQLVIAKQILKDRKM